jgi:hypothetical protein
VWDGISAHSLLTRAPRNSDQMYSTIFLFDIMSVLQHSAFPADPCSDTLNYVTYFMFAGNKSKEEQRRGRKGTICREGNPIRS